jgi:hypothetical protein
VYNFFIISELEVVLNDVVLIFLNLVLIELASLHFLEVPSNDELAAGGNYGVFLLPLALIEPRDEVISGVIK